VSTAYDLYGNESVYSTELSYQPSSTSENTPPEVTITAPATGSSFNLDDSITFTGTVTDSEDGNISNSLSWRSNFDGVIGSGAAFSTSALLEGTHTITASATDSSNLSGSATITVTVLSPLTTSITFDTGSSGFTYQDDTFRSTSNPGYASGNYDPSGGLSGGGLHVALGGVDRTHINGMSGGWSRSFVVNGNDTVNVTLWYRLVFIGDYESDECGQALVAIDGQLMSPESQDYLEEFCGYGNGNPTQDSGWRQVALEVFLTDGTHTITMGGWNSKKTYYNEVTDVFFDEIVITQQGQPALSETNCADGLDNDGDGLTDCSDPDCISASSCSPETVCDDGIDNDSDGLTDCDDPDCFGVDGCSAKKASCSGDFTPDGDVDSSDLSVFLDAYANGDLTADLNSSGVEDAEDLTIFSSEFGRTDCQVDE